MANPIITASVIDVNETTKRLTGDNTKLIRFYSNAKAEMSAEAQNGAAIDQDLYIIKNGSKTEFGTTAVFNNVESPVFHFGAQDSEGNIGNLTITAEMVDYIKLTCNFANSRPDALGNITVACFGNFFNGTFGAVNNTLTVKCRCITTGGSWTNMNITKSGNSYYASVNLQIPNFNQNQYYSFEVIASDALSTVTKQSSAVKSMPMFHWGESDFVFEVPVTFNGGINGGDIVVDQGESGGWTYRKWSSGLAECWKTFQKTVVPSDWSSWGSLYTASLVMNAALPFEFVSNKREFATIRGGANGFLSGGAWFMSSTTTGEYYVCSPTSYTGSYSYLTDIYVVGMWK